jgi:glutathione S-transferase
MATTTIDLRVGGRYELAMARPDGVVQRVHGVYREIDPPRRLVYSWQWATIVDFPETIVTVEFRPRADGGTDLVLVHDRLPDDAAGQRHTHGWTECLGKLAALVDGHETSLLRRDAHEAP